MKKMIKLLCILFVIFFTINFTEIIIKHISFIFLLFILLFLKKYRDVKKQVNLQRESFLKILNHDLKVTLLAQMRGLELLKNKEIFFDEKKELTNDLYNSSLYSLELINLLTDLYRIENKNYNKKYDEFDISEKIFAACKCFLNIADEKNIDFYYQVDCKDSICANELAFEKVLNVLLSTSVLLSNNNEKIYLRIQEKSGFIEMNIEYMGLPFRADSEFQIVGQGIKMNFCKKVLEMSGGILDYLRTGQKSYMFTFKLPIKTTKNFSKHLLQVQHG